MANVGIPRNIDLPIDQMFRNWSNERTTFEFFVMSQHFVGTSFPASCPYHAVHMLNVPRFKHDSEDEVLSPCKCLLLIVSCVAHAMGRWQDP